MPIRLVDGASSNVGRVEVYARTDRMGVAQWGTVCNDFWDIQDARVVCRQLGFPDALAAPWNAHYGPGTGPVLLDNVHCLGTESDLLTCEHNGIGSHNCYHYEDASVECLGMYICNRISYVLE